MREKSMNLMSELSLITLLLGMRHGLDWDHLAIIDSMTRRLPSENKWSHFVGFLFSLGHGMVVILFCILINLFFKNFALSDWLNTLMLILSIICLISFGSINIYSLLKSNKDSKKQVLYTRLFFHRVKFLNLTNPIIIVLVGGIFAVSFDTISQVALFSLNTTNLFGVLFSCFLGFMFMVGMMLTDGINGYLISFLIRKTSRFSFVLSRVLTIAIGLFSTTIGLCELVRLL